MIDWLIDWYAVGSNPYGPDAPRPYRQALCAPQSEISSGEPCSFTRIHMAPRLKILMSFGSKKGTQKYYTFLSEKSRQANPLPVPQRGPYGDSCLQRIFTYLLIYFFISKAPWKERPYMFPKSGAPMETDAYARALLNMSFGVPSKGALPRGPPHWASSERDAP
jgi:hypothetical protein